MTEKPFLDRYGGQTTDELIAMAETHRVDSIVLAFEQALDGKDPDALTPEEKVVLVIEAMERSVNNGGYRSFFDGNARYAADLIASLRIIGCSRMADIATRALDALDIEGPLTEEAVEEAAADFDRLSDPLGELDDEYYDVQTQEIVEDRLFDYIRENADKIRLDRS